MKYLRAVLNETLRLFPPGTNDVMTCPTILYLICIQFPTTRAKQPVRQPGLTMRAERYMPLLTRGGSNA
jgi:hypothetical protein